MVALSSEYMEVLKKVIEERYVPFLPELLGRGKLSVKDQQTKQVSRGFSAFVLHKLLNVDPKSAASHVFDDYNDNGIDAFYYDEKEETIYLLQSKLKKSEDFSQTEAENFAQGVRLFCNGSFDQFNENFLKLREEIQNAMENCSHIKLVVAYTGNAVSAHAESVFSRLFNDTSFDEERLVKEIFYFDSGHVTSHLLREQENPKIDIKLSFLKYDKFEVPRKTYFGVVKLKDLIDLHGIYGNSMYHRNIRYYLGSTKSGVNSSIKDTLESSANLFFYLNNGITAICENVYPKNANSSGRLLKVTDFSIINGAQTVATAYEFSQEHPDVSLEDAKVMLTLIKTGLDREFGKQVTKSRNHQNPVNLSAFAALDDNQEKLRKEMAMIEINYHYRSEIKIDFDERNISRDDAFKGLAMLKEDSRLPSLIKLDIARISNPSSLEYKDVFNENLSGVFVVNSVRCYKRFYELMSGAQAQARGYERLIYKHGFFVMLYVFIKKFRGLIGSPNLIDWHDQTIANIFSYEFDELRQQCFDLALSFSLNNKGPLSFFRSQSDTIPFLVDLMVRNYALDSDVAVIRMKNNVSHIVGREQNPERYPREKLIKYLSSKAPQLGG